jgi:20S proteasome alpha/beta subunit
MCFLRDECREIYRFVAIADQAWMSWSGAATDGQRLVRRAPERGQRRDPAC